jgi:hypothetical protein
VTDVASMNSVHLSGHAEEIVRAASRAPSLHNAQPWLFRVGAAEVEVWADLRRRIPVADPDDRQLFIGVGAAVYGVRLVLGHLGVRTMVGLMRDRTRPELAAVVTAVGRQEVDPEGALLRAQIERRRTVRMSFTDDPLPVPLQLMLVEQARREGVRLRWVAGERSRYSLAALISAAELAEQSTSAFRVELDRWVGRGATADGAGIPLVNVGAALATGPRGEFPLRDFDGDRGALTLPITSAEAHPGIAVLCTLGDRRADWLRAGQGLHRMLLAASAAGFAASFLNQALEIPALRAKVRDESAADGYPQVILRLGRPAQPLPPPTPRRPTRDVLLPPAPRTVDRRSP